MLIVLLMLCIAGTGLQPAHQVRSIMLYCVAFCCAALRSSVLCCILMHVRTIYRLLPEDYDELVEQFSSAKRPKTFIVKPVRDVACTLNTRARMRARTVMHALVRSLLQWGFIGFVFAVYCRTRRHRATGYF
jgi:hypothetical protein